MANARSAIFKSGLPRKGWAFENYRDVGSLSAACELCDTLHRHSYEVSHKAGGVPPMWVGGDCYSIISEEYAQHLSTHTAQIEGNVLDNRFRESKNGSGNFVRKLGGVHTVIYTRDDLPMWYVIMAGKQTGPGFYTPDEAAVFAWAKLLERGFQKKQQRNLAKQVAKEGKK